MNNLTIEDIHKIREEHANLTRNMNFNEYKAELRKDIKPLLDLLKSMKVKRTSYSADVEPNIAAELEFGYKTKIK
ncbi:MAG: hypothetical protein LBP96_04520 [Bacteroidales bacterium]|jgi:hypothetical protein|nr:hypothetical protein [Bacteroidales bacterium]